MERRHTIQKDMVLDAVQSLRNHATAEEVYEYVKSGHPSIGKGTVYRNLHVLAEEGLIRRIQIPNGSDRFDHNLDEHYHARCIKCQRIFDVDMDSMPDLIAKIRNNNGFQYLGYHILFYGVCSDCQNEEVIED